MEDTVSDKKILDASSRMALAALLHDLGKFAERSRIPEARIKDAEGNMRQSINEGILLPGIRRATYTRP